MKVKTRRVSGLTGSQRDYGLVTGSVWNYEDKPTSNNVGTTLSAVPRDEATIEAERGETVVGDLDNDGMVEHAKIGGKRHSQGGTPLNVPDGSFVFSDYRGLLIKNPDVLKNIFGMNTNKAVTPAKVAQRYEINKFKDMLNNPFVDPIDRKTAQLMIDNNMRKLGQLALIQEGMKGFPDGIPAIAQPLMGSDFAQQGGQQKMRRGGIVSFKKGGPAKYQGKNRSQVGFSSDLPDSGIVGYDEFGQPIYTDAQGTRIHHFDAQTGEPVYDAGTLAGTEVFATRPRKPILSYDNKNGMDYFNINPDTVGKAYAEENPIQTIFAGMSPIQNQQHHDAVKYMRGNDNQAGMLEFIGPPLTGLAIGAVMQKYGYPALNTLNKGAKYLSKLPYVEQAVKGIGKGLTKAKYKMFPGLNPTNPEYLQYMDDLQRLRKFSKTKAFTKEYGTIAADELLDPTTLERMFGTNRKLRVVGNAIKNTGQYMASKPGPVVGVASGIGKYLYDANEEANQIPDDALDANTGSSEAIDYNSDKIKYTPIKVQQITEDEKPVANKRRVIVTKPAPAGTSLIRPSGNAVELNMDSVNRFKSKELGGSLGEYQGQNKSQVFTQYTPESQISSTQDYDIVNPNIDIPYGFTVQQFDPKLGYYTITNPKTGQTIPLDMDNFVNTRHGALLDTYNGGRNAWRENALSQNVGTREHATEWFQKTYKDWRDQRGLSDYFYGDPKSSPYGVDKKLGIYTWSAPGIMPKVKPAETPQPQAQPQPEEAKITPPNWQKTKAEYPRPRRADLIGENAAAMQEIRRYDSIYNPIENSPTETIYQKFNPQTIMGMYSTALQNAGTGPDSARSVDNVTGKVLEGIAQGQQQTEEQVNNPRFMQMLAQNQQAKMRADAYNAAEKIRFQDDVASKWQDYLANYNKKLANVAEKTATTGENQYKLALTKAMYPYANLNFDETPTANATLNSITDEPMASSGSDNFSSTYQNVVKGYVAQGLSKEKAVEQANAYMRNYIAMNKVGTRGALTDPFGMMGS